MLARYSHPAPRISSLHGMVASAHPLASRAGIAAMERGGNAFDAAVAVAAALNVVEPFMSGLAGLGFAVVWSAEERRARVIDFVPKIPQSFLADRYSSRIQLARGAASVAVPGNLAGWHELSRSYGKLKFETLFDSAIRLAQDGFALSEFGAYEMAETAPELESLRTVGNGWRAAFPHASSAHVGQIIRQPDLATSFRQISEHGIKTFYGGALGEKVVDHIATLGGTLRLEDFLGVRTVWRDPLAIDYRGRTIHVPPPPSEAFQFLLTLKILEDIDFRQIKRSSSAHYDLIIRAIRLAAEVRIGSNSPTEDDLHRIFSSASVKGLRERLAEGHGVEGQTEQWAAAEPVATPDPAHTTSFSIADRDGNMVCVTQSLGSVFGSGVVVPGTGISLNNFLYWADVQPDSPNRSVPGMDFPTCMAPTISTKDGEPVLALGTPGSYGILQTQAQVMIQHFDFGLPLMEAIAEPRMRLWDGRLVEAEKRVPSSVIAELCGKGHDAVSLDHDWTMTVGGMQAVSRDLGTGLLVGAADPRRDGVAIPL